MSGRGNQSTTAEPRPLRADSGKERTEPRRNLSKWEEGFMDSITEQLEWRGSISDRKEEILERIYVEKTP